MSTQSRKWISERTPIADLSYELVGGKAWNLFRLSDLGFPVPPWCVVSSEVFRSALAPQKETIENILTTLDLSNESALEVASARIREMVLRFQFSEEWQKDLFGMIDREFNQEVRLSVRSSVVGEDSAQNSFAGQMDSFLNVPQEEVITAIKRVWASAYSSRALAYRLRKRISVTDVSTGVILQEMVNARASGILFSRDPETREERCVISAGFGLGEGVVANLVETDTYHVSCASNDTRKEIAVKEKRVVESERSEGFTRLVPLPVEMRQLQVLTDDEILQLRDVARFAEEQFGSPQDIEWAFDKSGQLFILQARPIVSPDGQCEDSSFRIWDNSNIVESYPGLTTPLTFSFIRSGYENTFCNVALGFTVFKKVFLRKLPVFKSMIGLLDGRVYYNLLNWYEMLSYLPGFEKHKKSWDQMIGINRKIEFPEKKLSGIQRISGMAIAAWRLLTVGRNAERFFSYFDSVYRKYKDFDFPAASEESLISTYEALDQELTDRWHLTLYNDFSAMKYYDWLKTLCSRWGLDEYTNLHNQLLCGEKGVESVEPLRSLVSIAQLFRGCESYRKLICESDEHLIWQKIQTEDDYAPLKKAIEFHLQTYGDRGLEELKLDKPTFRDDPASLIRLIKNYFTLALTVETMEKQEREIRGQAEKFVQRRLKNPLKRLAFQFVLRNARRAIVNRENMRFGRSRLYGIVRRLFRRMGELFANKGLLDAGVDIHFLTVEEVFGFVGGTATTQNLRALVDLRKSEYAEFARRTPNDRIETHGIPYLHSLLVSRTAGEAVHKLKGIGCTSGVAEGLAKVVMDPKSVNGSRGHILVARSTDPGWVFLMISSKGIVVEKGSVLSHTAIIGRELGIPTVVGVQDATKCIPDGARVSIDGSTGEVQWE